jgi:hypothetical protein
MRIARPVLAMLFLACACGGRVEGADGGTPGASQAEPEAGPPNLGDNQLPCPLLPPPPGAACDYPSGQVCAYIGSGLPCQAVQCGNDGVWAATHQGC